MSSTTTELEQAVAELVTEVRGLVEQIREMREEQGTEVRTRRLVVVDETGFERVVIDTCPESGWVKVAGRADERGPRSVQLIAEDGAGTITSGGTARYAGLYLTARDEAVGHLEVLDDEEGAAITALELSDVETRWAGRSKVARTAHFHPAGFTVAGMTVGES